MVNEALHVSQYKYVIFGWFLFPVFMGVLFEHCFRILLLGISLYIIFPVVYLAIILHCITCHSLGCYQLATLREV